MCICVFINAYTYIHIYTQACDYLHTSPGIVLIEGAIRICIYMHVYIHTHTSTCMYIYTCLRGVCTSSRTFTSYDFVCWEVESERKNENV